jgi:hypothetical protein
MPSSKNIDLQRDFVAGVCLSEFQTPLHTVQTVYLFTQEEGESWTRENVRGASFYKAGQKYQHDWLYL